ncbi:centromere protein U isoform X1 [Mugil cephalus]|uniref:centromere protein U isoform X1 n=1 Tax=Mugil cephalus TaxID=48193 RepID=UPI001FB6CC69|nr:centromere protein U isoform X1 [Mugil cephalus]
MSAKKRRGAKVLQAPPGERQKPNNEMENPNLSTIDNASFLEGLQRNNGNPLHSTAIDEDLNLLDDKMMERGRAGAVVKRKGTKGAGDNEEEEEKKKRKRSTGDKVKSRPEEERVELDVEKKKKKKKKKKTAPAPEIKRGLVGKKPAMRKSEGRPEENQPPKKDKKTRSDSGTESQRPRRDLSSDEEGDEESEWKPSPKKARMAGLGTTGKSSLKKPKHKKSSSSGSTSAEDKTDKQRRKKQSRKTQTELEVVLDAFLDFCDQYRETVKSEAVKQSIDSFSDNVRDQLSEKISSCKEFRVLQRENTKVGSLIRKKTQRMLNVKHELMRAERQVGLLKKEKTQLEVRLADLRRGHEFLQDVKELNRRYLDYRRKHPKEKETYGASSLPALLLEAKYVKVAEEKAEKK